MMSKWGKRKEEKVFFIMKSSHDSSALNTHRNIFLFLAFLFDSMLHTQKIIIIIRFNERNEKYFPLKLT